MSVSAGPNVVSNGLVFEYDMSNTQRSWKGAPTTNLLTYSESANTVYNLSSGSFGPDAIVSPAGTLTADRINLTAGAMNSWDVYRTVSVTSGVVYTFSMYILLGTSTNFCVVINNTQAWDTVARQCFTSANGLNTLSWARITLTFTAPVSGAINIHLGSNYESALSATPQSGGYAYMWGTQLEVGSYATPVIITGTAAVTRSNTQAILDLTNNNTITTNSLTYASDNTFSFTQANGDYLSFPLTGNSNSNVTASCWAYVTLGTHGTIFKNSSGANGFCIGIGDSTLIANGNNIVGLFPVVRWIPTGVSYGTTGWKNVVMTMDASSVPTIYVNGVLIGTYSGTSPVANTGNACVGRCVGDEASATDRTFTGQISSVAFYNRSLSAAEVSQNFNAIRGRYGI